MGTVIGKTNDGKDITAVTIKNKNGMCAEVMDFGATLLKLIVPDGTDVVLGYENISDYLTNNCYYGCTVARNGNRIGGAAFDLEGVHYELEKNDNGHNNLHSGSETLAKRLWTIEKESESSVTFSFDSPDGDMGFPGHMQISVTYTLDDNNALILDYSGTTDKTTIFNPTNHTYFNLNGQVGGTILEHKLLMDADSFTYADVESIPDGVIRGVQGTPMDFTTPHTLAERTDADYDVLHYAGGYDHNWCLNMDTIEPAYSKPGMDVFFAATLEASGRRMDVYTSLPGLQMYAGNYMKTEEIMKGGKNFTYRGGIALETQYFPNAINIPEFDQPIVKAGETAESRTVYKFS